jgi:hypothetical protein
MSSKALLRWQRDQEAKLDQLEAAHRAVGGSGPGRRYLTQLNHAYLVMLAAQWQDFCRNLHSEAADAIVRAIDPPTARLAVQGALTLGRLLDRGNAGPGTLGADFARFGGRGFWDVLDSLDKRNVKRRLQLEQLHIWRNGVAHQDFNWTKEERRTIKNTTGTLNDVRAWRGACNALAQQFDRAVAAQVADVVGRAPW